MQFAVDLAAYCHLLKKDKEFEIRSQLFRSGTSIGVNVFEAQGSESRRDFIHKLSIGYKETLETDFWIQLCKRSDYLPDPGPREEQVKSLRKLLGKILTTLHNAEKSKKM